MDEQHQLPSTEASPAEREIKRPADPKSRVSKSKDAEPAPKPSRYSPPNCSSCTARREAAGLSPKQNFTSVYSMRTNELGILRYCKCGYCGRTFKDVEPHPKTPKQLRQEAERRAQR